MKLWIFASVVLSLVLGCGQDNWESERDNDELINPQSGRCIKSTSTGCLQGQIPAAPDLTVQGETFFDANDLAASFKELLPPVENSEGKMLVGDQLELKWISKVDNSSFADGFHIYLKGASARDQKVLSNGAFAVNRLQAGIYEVRAQKEFRFTLTEVKPLVTPVDEDVEGAEESAEPQVEEPAEEFNDQYCATLYQEESYEIRKGYKTGTVVFDSFEVDLKRCGQNEEQATIQLSAN